MNKKGQIFTLIAISLIVLMFLSVEVYSHIREKNAIKDRVKSMDSFLQALEKNLERQAYISGFRIIFLGISQRVAKGTYVTNLQDFSEEAFFNGTVDGVASELMIGATLDDLVESVNEKARKINVNISMLNTNISMSQDDPWTVKFVIASDFVMRDLQGLASWNRTQNVTAYIPVTSFEDPLYLKSAGGRGRKINQTIFEGEYNVSGDVSNLSEHMQKGYFANNTNAPSFLGRLTGVLSASDFGIESFVDTNNLTTDKQNEFDPTDTKSVIDYIYFDATDTTTGNSIVGIPSRFRIDNAHKSRYQLL